MKNANGNERAKRAYLVHLRDARRRDQQTVDMVARSISQFEESTGGKDFKKFHREQARAFKSHLDECTNARTGKKLSPSTIYATLGHVKGFFCFLAGEPGYKSRVTYSDADYFNPSDKIARMATAHREKVAPSLDSIRSVILAMPITTGIERRDRALIAFTIVTGARDGAIITIKLKHVDIANRLLRQDAREVDTKFGKTFDTWFFPVGDDLIGIVSDWIGELRANGYGDDDPAFPKTNVAPGADQQFAASGLSREHWATALPMRDTFRRAFAAAGLPYANPHSFRNTLAQLAYELKLDPEALKAWSQNLGHENVLTTLTSYGVVASFRQAEIMRGLAKPKPPRCSDAISLDDLAAFVEAHRRGDA